MNTIFEINELKQLLSSLSSGKLKKIKEFIEKDI